MTSRNGVFLALAIALLAGFVPAQTPATTVLQPLLTFTGIPNGGQPWAAPILDRAGNLYGATSMGGNGSCTTAFKPLGCGTVYKLTPSANGTQWTQTVLYQFADKDDGTYPAAGLVFDKAGNLYGTTYQGGTNNCGTIFELSPPAGGTGPWSKTTLHSFTCGTDGGFPEAGMAFDKAGNLYGTATFGGCSSINCNGAVFQLTPPTSQNPNWTYSVIYSFLGAPDGSDPRSTPVFDRDGNLYGTTVVGGTGIWCNLDENCGTVFRLSPPTSAGGAWTETVLYSFSTFVNDAAEPDAGVFFGGPGVLYGVTAWGGSAGRGTVYQLTAPSSSTGTWTESILYSFLGGADGSSPIGLPALGTNGSIYGLTIFGGSSERGNIFQLSPPATTGDPWTETSLYEFHNLAYPVSGLTLGKGGWLYGTTMGGVLSSSCVISPQLGCGEVFRILPR